MAHIDLGNNYPGIRGPMAFRPETAKPLNELAEVLLRGDNSLTRGERELIASYVSAKNDCFFCQHLHGSIAEYYFDCGPDFINSIREDFISSDASDKMKGLLWIASSVQRGGKNVTSEQIETAKSLGASDIEIHDTVLIAAAFCMFNRYVDGLATWAPGDTSYYVNRAKENAEEGYADCDVSK